ncbi:MAG: DUF4423 domain-containing protein [Bdellovibrionaceae bacterium]|nr:DUF4423 domain-containing protein [Pseudobdellovibrionaceae bacterium]
MKNENRPSIYQFYDPIHFLNEWFVYLKKSKDQFKLNDLAKKSEISTANLSLILSRQRPLTEKSFQKIINFIHLDATERKYLNQLRIIDQSENSELRIEALNQIVKICKNKSLDSNDYKVFEYLTKWYYVAIFEMFNLDQMQLDPIWIQKKLIKKISLLEIEQCIEFLKIHGYVTQNENGKWVQVKAQMDCREGVFKLSLGEFHRQMLSLASYSIDSVKREDRFIMGQTMALSKDDFIKVKEIVERAIFQINEINKSANKRTEIYHIEIATFPLALENFEKDHNE